MGCDFSALRRHPRVHGVDRHPGTGRHLPQPRAVRWPPSAPARHVDLLAQQAVATRAPLVAVASASREEVTTAIGAYAAQAGLAAYRPGGGRGRRRGGGCANRRRRGPQRDHRLDRPAADPRGAESGAILALANKESLIVGGPLVKALARLRPDRPRGLRALGDRPEPARRAGGGGAPARGHGQRGSLPRAVARGAAVRHPDQALAHPNFAMGRVITTNSATLVNKGSR